MTTAKTKSTKNKLRPITGNMNQEGLDVLAEFTRGSPVPSKSTLHNADQTFYVDAHIDSMTMIFERKKEGIVALSYDFDGNCIGYEKIRCYDHHACEEAMKSGGFAPKGYGHRLG